ncbi:hypothetical protein C7M84_010409 [Penaeus vannamei]|uniref:Uncharacterized protein n=1 Tax=Penaeus vannamei TaxID=6689 RepID=A0A423T440_PENVA|nr:hypothetical protein C7M84_010409 [Penaeus vannamei]
MPLFFRASCCILRVPRRFEAPQTAHTPENPLPNRIPFLPEIVRRIGNKVLVLGKKKSRFRYRIFSRAELGRSARHEGATSQGRGRWSRDGGVAHWATGKAAHLQEDLTPALETLGASFHLRRDKTILKRLGLRTLEGGECLEIHLNGAEELGLHVPPYHHK